MRLWRARGGIDPIGLLEDLHAELFSQRGVGAADANQFFTPSYDEAIGNPFQFVGMSDAVDRLLYAAKKGERILVWGDYDADGVSGTAVVVEALQMVGANVAPYLPHRSDEGYGLNQPALERLIDNFDVLVTVDCGGSNVQEIAWVAGHKKDVIIVDHHELPAELPPAMAILHPRHPAGPYHTSHLSGAGVGWKLAQGLLRHHGISADEEKWLLDLPLIGTLADSMPLVAENRAIVKFGLQVLHRTRRLGLRALIQAARLPVENISARDVAFRIIPAINAAGRMDHPQLALDALLAKTTVQATRAAQELTQLNNRRRQVTAKIVQEANEFHDPALPLVFAFNAAWPAGVVGIVAGQLAEKHNKPAVIVGGARQSAVGSARSFGDIDIHAALQQAAAHTLKLGGHKQAAGFSVKEEHMEDFRSAIIAALENADSSGDTAYPAFEADAVIDDQLLSWDTYGLVRKFEPFGEGNREPAFVLRNLAAVGVRKIGRDGKHLKVTLVGKSKETEAIGFSLAGEAVSEGQPVDVLGSLKLNQFSGTTRLQFQLADIAPTGSVTISE